MNTRNLSHEKVIGSTQGKAAVAAGLGIAFVSLWTIQDELAQGRVARIPLVDLYYPAHLPLGASRGRTTAAGGRIHALPRIVPARSRIAGHRILD